MVTNRPKGPDAYDDPERPGDHAGLLSFYDRTYLALVDALGAAEPSDEAWTWSQDHTVAFIYRRQAHEALIHRRDAELAAGTITPFPADLAADGVDEVLDVMYGGCPPWGEFSPLPHYIRVDLTDTGDRVWVQLGRFHGTDPDGIEHKEDDLHVVTDPGVEPDAVISGTAGRSTRGSGGVRTAPRPTSRAASRSSTGSARSSTSRSPDRSPHRPTAVLGGSADSQSANDSNPNGRPRKSSTRSAASLRPPIARIRSR
jgi:hypothetical protein